VVGTGSIFANTPVEILYTKKGYAGCINPHSAFYSKAGYFFIDREQKKVFLLNDKLEELSNKGMRGFFTENLDFEILDQLRERGYDGDKELFIGDPVPQSFSMGYVTTYDESNDRIIVTKKGYKFTATGETLIGTPGENTNNFYYVEEDSDGINRLYRYLSGVKTLVVPGVAGFDAHFEEDSWTWSYSILEEGFWSSRHTYVPSLLFQTSRNFYSILDQELHRHNIVGANGSYFGVSGAKSYIDIVFPFQEAHILSALKIKSKIVVDGDIDHEDTFDLLMVYNSNQCSDELTVTPGTNARYIKSKWNFNSFRDIVFEHNAPFLKDYEVISSNIAELTDTEDAKYLPWHKRKRFIDQYHIIRIGSRNSAPKELYLLELDISHRPAYR
jgi:hypothetical protein